MFLIALFFVKGEYMRILLTNDDGIFSEGLLALIRVFTKEHEVIVVAPSTEQSGMAHALTVKKDIEVEKISKVEEIFLGVQEPFVAWKVYGTPTDCVKLYLEALAGDKYPELIVSGINHGANLGTDVLYSGTVGAAMEGYLHKITSLAISLEKDATYSYDKVATIFYKKLPYLLEKFSLPSLLNVNFPKVLNNSPSFKLASLCKRDYQNAFHRHERDGKVYFYMGGEICDRDVEEDQDTYFLKEGNIAVTPLQLDLTNKKYYL